MNSSGESPVEELDTPQEEENDFIEDALREDDPDEDAERLQRIRDAQATKEPSKVREGVKRLKQQAREQHDKTVEFAHKYRAPILGIVCGLILVAGIVSYSILSNQALKDGATVEAFNILFFFTGIGCFLTTLYYLVLSRVSLRKRSELADNEEVQAYSPQHWMCLAPYVVLFGASLYGVYFAQANNETPSNLVLVLATTLGVLLLGLTSRLIRLYRYFRSLEKSDYVKWIGWAVGVILFTGGILAYFGALDDVGGAIVRFFVGLYPMFVASPSRPIEVATGFVFVALVLRAMTWRINPVVATDTRLVAPEGLLRRRTPSMGLDKITDQDTSNNFQLPWVTLTLESAGQKQAITKLRFVPRKFLHKIKQPKQELGGSVQ